MQEQTLKGSIAGIGVLTAYFIGNFTPLIWLLGIFEVMDYITGMYAAFHNRELSSDMAVKGFFKKMFYFFLVAVAFGFDYMIHEATAILDLNFTYPAIFGVLSVAYLLSTEMISIVENLEDIGLTVPFITRTLRAFRDKVEKAGGDIKLK